MKSVKKIKSVASALSVIDFEHLWSSRSEEHVNSVCVGTVFQTAAFFLFLISRLRPGTINMTRMAVWKTVPYKLFRLRLTRHVQNLSRIKRMRRICSFTDFYCVVGFLCACGALGLSRIISYWRNPAPYRRKYNPKEILYNIQDQIKKSVKR